MTSNRNDQRRHHSYSDEELGQLIRQADSLMPPAIADPSIMARRCLELASQPAPTPRALSRWRRHRVGLCLTAAFLLLLVVGILVWAYRLPTGQTPDRPVPKHPVRTDDKPENSISSAVEVVWIPQSSGGVRATNPETAHDFILQFKVRTSRTQGYLYRIDSNGPRLLQIFARSGDGSISGTKAVHYNDYPRCELYIMIVSEKDDETSQLAGNLETWVSDQDSRALIDRINGPDQASIVRKAIFEALTVPKWNGKAEDILLFKVYQHSPE